MESTPLCLLRILWWEISASGWRIVASVFPNTTAFSSIRCETRYHSSHVPESVACDSAFMIKEYCEGSHSECSPHCMSNTRISNFTLERSVPISLPMSGIFPVRGSGISIRLFVSWWGPLHKRWENQLPKYACKVPANPHYFTATIFH